LTSHQPPGRGEIECPASFQLRCADKGVLHSAGADSAILIKTLEAARANALDLMEKQL
jgi:hypothetical protein